MATEEARREGCKKGLYCVTQTPAKTKQKVYKAVDKATGHLSRSDTRAGFGECKGEFHEQTKRKANKKKQPKRYLKFSTTELLLIKK